MERGDATLLCLRRAAGDERRASVESGEGLSHAANALSRALLVLDEREPHIAFSPRTKSDAGRGGDTGFAYEERGELDRAHLLEPTNRAFGRDVVWCPPAYANHAIVVRNDKEIIRVSLAAE